MSYDPIHVNQHGDTTVITLEVRILDQSIIQRVRKVIARAIEGLSRFKVVLDLRLVQFISSEVLSVLITINKQVNETEGQFVLANIDPQIYEVFEITKLNKLFNIVRDLGEDDDEATGVTARLKPKPPSDGRGAALPLPRKDN